MIGFLSGVAVAVVLSIGTWFALETFTQTSIERILHPALQMEGVAPQFELGPDG